MTFQLIQRHMQECKTPNDIIINLTKEFGSLFDPCPLNPKMDGLGRDWLKRTYVNPPYNNISAWLEKSKEELKKKTELVIFLLPVDTSTKWFHNYIFGKAEIRFIKGRLRFTDNKPAPFASMIVIFKRLNEPNKVRR